ncbi:MAG: hypothetical protein H8Z69_02600 [Nanohaloarchaea archaeon]|nr:hypothetical protein [Candidatus Nanohaloarchaea archaeon]
MSHGSGNQHSDPARKWEKALAHITIAIILSIGRVTYSVFASVFRILTRLA